MKIAEYLKSLIKVNSGDSSKSFALLCSVLSGVQIALCTSFCMIWDVCSNDYIKTDLDKLGTFLVCVGLFMVGGGINKAVGDIKTNKQ